MPASEQRKVKFTTLLKISTFTMSGKMEMSLDDIIKQNKKNKPRTSSGTGAKRGNRRPTNSSSRKGGAIRSPRKPGGGGGGGVMRGRNRGGISRNRPSSNFGGRTNLRAREAFLGPSGGRKFGSETTKLIVSNLDFGVTDSDILELFSEFGPLKSAGVHYDRSGRSLGSADLIFERRSDAIKAMKQYNGVPLDGREMNIQLATSEIPRAIPSRTGGSGGFRRPSGNSSSRPGGNKTGGSRPAGNKTGGSRPGGNRAGTKGRGPAGKRTGTGAAGSKPAGGRQPKKVPTAEELDAELEEYVKSKVSSSDGA